MSREFIKKSEISDVMIERPVSFSIKNKHFCVYPATLGKIQLMARLIEAMNLDSKTLSKNLNDIVLGASGEHREKCMRLIAYSTLPGDDCLDENKVQQRLKELRKIDSVDIASILIVVLSHEKTEAIMRQFHIDMETKRYSQVMKVKQNDKNSLLFGGKSVWGALIDAACERYGWTYQYVLWGVSYSNLQLMLADQVRSVYLTDEERKSLHISTDSIVVRADDSESLNRLIKTQSWK